MIVASEARMCVMCQLDVRARVSRFVTVVS